MSSNLSVLADKDGEYSDWIELYNYSASSVNLLNWCLTDDKTLLSKWKFPEIFLPAGGYLVVFASAKDIDDVTQLHSNFKLSAAGEYLALSNPSGNIINEFDPYPNLDADLSYGFLNGDYLVFPVPTPGRENESTGEIILPLPDLDHQHGFYNSPFQVTITSPLSDKEIFYTLDGSEPSQSNGILYTSPIQVNKTTLLRAVEYKKAYKSKITTATYLFLDDVIKQPDNPSGYPALWGQYFESQGTAIADYGMDPEITNNPEYSSHMKEALLSIPTLSIVTKKEYLFSHTPDPDSGGIYIYTGPPDNEGSSRPGGGWERPVSVEFFNNNHTEDFQIDCGIMIHGGASRLPDKTPKHSFRLVFKNQYGPGKLVYPLYGDSVSGEFNSVVLRASYGNTWLHRSASERGHAQLIHDIWGKDTQLDMLNPAGHGIYVHLYINGMYWGIYNPTERIDKEFAAKYHGGREEDYDVIKDFRGPSDGNMTAWNKMFTIAKAGLADNTRYQLIQGKNPDGTINPEYPAYLDVESFIDYMVINYYGANWDWDHHNGIAIRNRINPGKGFQFFSWDAEHIDESVSSSVLDINNTGKPTGLFHILMENADFKRLFADRVQLHCYNNGALTPQAGSARWEKRANQIETAIIAESARWGDYRRDVHRAFEQGPFDLYTKAHWDKELSFMMNTFFPRRTSEFIKQLKSAGFLPSIDAPKIYVNGSPVAGNIIKSGDKLVLTSSSGTVYYTTDGSDPCNNNQASPAAVIFKDALELNHTTHIKARSSNNNEWSSLVDYTFILPEDVNCIKITEINYHPLAEDTIDERHFEFIELKNTASFPINLSGMKFTSGISYTFPQRTLLNGGNFIVLASDMYNFSKRYGFNAFDIYEGTLSNSGERIIIESSAGDTLLSIRYNDKSPWPDSADGGGYSIVPCEVNPTGSQDEPAKWRASSIINGTPGTNDEISGINTQNEYGSTAYFLLDQNYPNPFNPSTSIGYRILKPGIVTLKIFNILGQELLKVVDKEYKTTGKYSVEFNAGLLSSGIYLYTLNVDGKFSSSKKMVLIR